MVLAAAIFTATLVLVIWQPKGLGIGWSALAGAGVALATGVVQLSDVPVVWDLVWNATLTFVAVIIISSILDEAGFFEWAALHVARWGRGNGRMLFNLIVVLGAAVAALFANDGAALTLTPIVFQMIVALRFPPKVAFALVMATGFIADATSLPFIVSNLVNIVIADYFGIGFARYALVMIPLSLVSLLASLLMLRLLFRRDIPGPYDVAALGSPADAVRDRLTFRAGGVVLAVLLVGYFAADPLGVPVAAVAASCAAAISLVAARRPGILFRSGEGNVRYADVGNQSLAVGGVASVMTMVAERTDTPGTGESRGPAADVISVIRSAPWQIVLFSLGMYLVVYGMRNQGLTDQLGLVFAGIAANSTIVTATGTGFLVAVMSSVMNNMPTALISALGIDAAGVDGVAQQVMIYASIIGADLGPKITPIGSLATLLWLSVLDRKGMHVGWGTYFRTGIVLTVPVLAVTLVALAGWLTILGA